MFGNMRGIATKHFEKTLSLTKKGKLKEALIELEKAEARLSFSGESMGAAVALSLAYTAKNFDRDGISVAALPNNEKRHLYRQLFFGDFVKCCLKLVNISKEIVKNESITPDLREKLEEGKNYAVKAFSKEAAYS